MIINVRENYVYEKMKYLYSESCWFLQWPQYESCYTLYHKDEWHYKWYQEKSWNINFSQRWWWWWWWFVSWNMTQWYR